LNFEYFRGGNMPFIRGRYHLNPVLGEALEAAREAEAALLELEQQAQQTGDDSDDSGAGGGSQKQASAKAQARQPIHRVEIEAGEMVPAHSGRAERGFVARVHRQPVDGPDEQEGFAASPAHRFVSHNSSAARPVRGASPQAETHVFADHGDLLNFLREELARDCKK
jgi:hypothetical protein